MVTTGQDPAIAQQIADLINQHNQLTKTYSSGSILVSQAQYYPIIFMNKHVLACVALEKLDFLLTVIKHLVVMPELRGHGLGKNLVRESIKRIKTPAVVASIRSDNTSSVQLFNSLGFSLWSELENFGHKLKLLGRTV